MRSFAPHPQTSLGTRSGYSGEVIVFARVVYSLGIAACLVVGALAGAYVLVQLGPAQPAWWSCGAVPVLFAAVALVACFTPYDAPESTPRWVGVLVGAALGGAGVGILCFPLTFLALSPLGVAYAVALRWAALTLSRASLLEAEREEPLRGMRYPGLAGAGIAAMALIAMRPAGEGPRPVAGAEASVAPILSRPAVTLERGRVRRLEGSLQASGRRVRVRQSLQRPRVQVELRKQTLVVEPCLRVTRGATDGFLFVGQLNGYGLELEGLAKAAFVEGWQRGWTRADFLRAQQPRGFLPHLLGAGPEAEDLSGSVVVLTDLESGWVAIEGLTRVRRWLPVSRAEGCRIELALPRSGRVNLGLGGGAQWEVEGQGDQALIFGEEVRLTRVASRGRVASAVGEELEWLVIEGPRFPILILAPDWKPQASQDRVRAGPPGFLANSLTARRAATHLTLVFDPGSSRFAAAPLSTWIRPGVYRTRVALTALNPGEGPRAAARALTRQLRW